LDMRHNPKQITAQPPYGSKTDTTPKALEAMTAITLADHALRAGLIGRITN